MLHKFGTISVRPTVLLEELIHFWFQYLRKVPGTNSTYSASKKFRLQNFKLIERVSIHIMTFILRHFWVEEDFEFSFRNYVTFFENFF